MTVSAVASSGHAMATASGAGATSNQASTTVRTNPSFPDRPKLRKVDRFDQGSGEDARVVLRDPLGVAEPASVPRLFARVLDLLDGTRTLPQIRQSLMLRGGLDVSVDELAGLVTELADGGWLDGEDFRRRFAALLQAFLLADVRAPRSAGVIYPDDRDTCVRLLNEHVPPSSERITAGSDVVGVLLPHGPPELVGPVVDLTLRGLPPADAIELVIVLGTDHGSGLLPYAITAKPYATPLGRCQAARETLEALERRVPWITREEIRHRDAMSIELAVLYLQHVYGDALPPVVPLLCGRKAVQEEEAADVQSCVAALEALTEDRPVLFVGSAELSHSGPAYGRPAVDAPTRAAIEAHDRLCLTALGEGQTQRLAARCREGTVQGHPSGGAVMTTLSQLLPTGGHMELVDYRLRPAPGPTPGEIGIAGARFHRESEPRRSPEDALDTAALGLD